MNIQTYFVVTGTNRRTGNSTFVSNMKYTNGGCAQLLWGAVTIASVILKLKNPSMNLIEYNLCTAKGE